MSLDDWFGLTFPLVAPFWALMIVLPGWSWTRRIVGSPLIVLPPLLVYLAIVLPRFGDFWSAYTSPSLPGLQSLLGSPAGSAAIWAHLIAFDLFVGRWMYLDARERRVHPLLMAPVLFFTILVSPVGLVSYLGLRHVAARSGAGGPGDGRTTDTTRSAPAGEPIA